MLGAAPINGGHVLLNLKPRPLQKLLEQFSAMVRIAGNPRNPALPPRILSRDKTRIVAFRKLESPLL
jgi:hypothetical protein